MKNKIGKFRLMLERLAIKRIKNKILAIVAVFVFGVFFQTIGKTEAIAASISAPKTVIAKEGVFYTYWDAHRKELTKKGYIQGDIGSVYVKWSTVSSADGYQVRIKWNSYDNSGSHTDVIDVTKKGKKYIMTSKKTYEYGPAVICSTPKNCAIGNGGYTITTKKPAFVSYSGGSIFYVKKVSVKSYKVVNGKKVWSKTKTLKPKSKNQS